MVKKALQFRKVSKRYKSDIHCVRNVGIDDLNYVSHNVMGISGVEIS